MKPTKRMFAVALSFLVLNASSALAQGHGHGKGHKLKYYEREAA